MSRTSSRAQPYSSTWRERAIDLGAFALDRLARPREPIPDPRSSSPQRILAVKPCCLGDLLMATPALRALKRRFPKAQLDVLTARWAAPALESNSRVARLLSYPDHLTPTALLHIIRAIRAEHYDLAVSFDRSPLVNTLLWLARIPIRVGIDSRHRGVGLTHRVSPRADEHESKLFLRVVAAIGASADDLGAEYAVPEHAERTAADVLPYAAIRQPFVVIHPGGAVNPGTTMLSKRWPAASFAALATRLADDADATIALVGAGSDRPAVDAVKQAAGIEMIDLCERLSLPELAAVIRRASLYVGNDSGISHLAAAGTPTVTIFGPTSPRRYCPLGRTTRVCAPPASWSLNGAPDLRSGTHVDPSLAIDQVTVAEVFHACLELLSDASRRRPARDADEVAQ